MDAAFRILLIAVLALAVVSFAAMGARQHRRTRRLGRIANERGLRFSAEDPFGLVYRCAEFALIASGHSVRAENVISGSLAGQTVRAFDLWYEVGHGTRRISRHYGVFIADFPQPLPAVLMWNDRDAEAAPLISSGAVTHRACWTCTGSDVMGELLAGACLPLAEEGASMQVRGRTLLLCLPDKGRSGEYACRLPVLAEILETIQARAEELSETAQPPSPNRDFRLEGIENPGIA
ncbi:MAG TPA: hypothetical protein PK082_10970 [Phycisphaerae bacterium]|nr:hypothetical protein [Phycisphaerae bacterium]